MTIKEIKKGKLVSNALERRVTTLERLCQKLTTPSGHSQDTTKHEVINPQLEFARMDYDLVRGEIIDIKSCRSNIFIGTLGILGAIGTAILSIVGVSNPPIGQGFFLGIYRITIPMQSSYPDWLFWACLIPIVLLVCSIFATIHKAKGLNMRVSYLEVLGEYLANEKKPEYWRGWLKAKQVFDRCRIYMKYNKEKISSCEVHGRDKQNNPNKEKNNKLSCFVGGKKESLATTEAIPILTTPLNSFTSLTTYIYGSFLIISSGILLFVLMNIAKGSIAENSFNSIHYWGIVVSGVIVTLFLYILKTCLPKKGSESLLKKCAQRFYGLYSIICGIIVPLVLLTLLYKQIWDISYYSVVIAYTLGVAISISIVLFVCYFYNQISSLRKGKFSPERWRHVWKLCFEYCPLMKDETPTICFSG